MPEYTELTLETHRDLKVDPRCAVGIAEKQHIITLRVNEVGYAANQFPLFFSRADEKANWMISAINSFEIEKNLFVEDKNWTGAYVPIGMQTYPFFLMRKEGEENQFCIGIDESNEAFSKTDGEPLFLEDEKASHMLTRATKLLEQELNNEVQSIKFGRYIAEHKLIKEVDVVVKYQDGRVNTLKGLNTVDEAVFNALSDEDFLEMRKLGYLLPMYSMITSTFQLNTLLTRHNKQHEAKIVQVTLEAPGAMAEKQEADQAPVAS